MSDFEMSSFPMPSNPADIKHIMDVMFEISGSKARVEGERDFQKEAIGELSEKFGIPKKMLNRFAKAYHKQNYHEEKAQDAEFEALVDRLVGNNS